MAEAIIAADALLGDRIVDRDGKPLGTVEDIAIDVESGAIAYVLVSCGSTASLDEKLVAIPWGAIRRDMERHCFVLQASREQLAQYGVPPYWTS